MQYYDYQCWHVGLLAVVLRLCGMQVASEV